MNIGKPGVVVITDDAGTWTAGILSITANENWYGPAYDTTKDQSMSNLAAAVGADAEVESSIYSAGSHTITITPKIGKQLFVECVKEGSFVGTMTFATATTSSYPSWATGAGAEITEPSLGEKATGWIHEQKPPASWFNWFKNLTYQWVRYFEDQCLVLLNLILYHAARITVLESKTSWISGTCDLVFPNTVFTYEQTIGCRYSLSSDDVVMLTLPNISGTSNSMGMLSSNALPTEIRPPQECVVPCRVQCALGYRLGAARIYANGQVAFEVAQYDDGVDDKIFYSLSAFDASGNKGVLTATLIYDVKPLV
jgi:hypothetical protein